MAAETQGEPGRESIPDPQEMVFDSTDVEDFLVAVTGEFMRDIDGDSRGISWAVTFFRSGSARTAAAGSAAARAADEEQCSFADGPVLEAVRAGDFVHLADVGRDRRWPGYASAAADHGVRSLLSTPVVAAAEWSAALSLYASTPHAFTSEDIIRTRRYARHVARSLLMVVCVAERAAAGAQLAVAQSSMVLMDLAVSTLESDYGLGHDAALQYLRTVARHTRHGLRETALNIVAASRADQAGRGRENASFRGLSDLETPPLRQGHYITGSTA
ncbi:GAF domain-containing protein [Pseudarthrobacter sp. AL07]|uniref:GAF domain-containing protein n=1 Tax=unclassified Pseudarthrobacter TaxID=2647000 RepID=UPI00249C5090|nr:MULTISPECIES: GAF domain-containing protein [unclassified Pseudarthrobacter]MDI3193893.1 GAF domain-containing protein [Pseudarthrobacter sp. AL20]MDI3208146.1 GAF domain-containing protein [Pseudarthrobacter sp. AL07]